MKLKPYEETGLPTYDVDLEAPPDTRWNHIARQEAKNIGRLLDDVVNLCVEQADCYPVYIRPLVVAAGRFHRGNDYYTSVSVLGCVGVVSTFCPGKWVVTISQAPTERLNPLLAAVTLAVLCSPLMVQELAKPKPTPRAKAAPKAPKKINWDRVAASVDTHDPAYIEAATAAIRETMDRNFQASSADDLKALMATMTSNCPDRENFQKERKKMFEETDAYIRLVGCRWITSWQDSRGLWAAVEITQWTIPKDDKVEYSEHRHRSGLLPEYELCVNAG